MTLGSRASDRGARASGRRSPSPSVFQPQLATLVAEAPAGERWLHELKYDGYRIGCRLAAGNAQLFSRNGKDWTERFRSVREAVSGLPVETAFLDGEIAVVLPDGRTSFQALQNSFSSGTPEGQLVYFLFDLLHLDGEDLTALPLEQRKTRLQRLLGRRKGVLRYSAHVIGNGAEVLAEACRQGAEGIVSKRRDLPYRPGRGADWVKVKCIRRQELVIGGFTDPQGSRSGIGALLVGVYGDDRQLVFAGKVGTGFTQASAHELRRRLEEIESKDCPFAVRPKGRIGRNVHWVAPRLVAEVAFTEWTADGKIRHPSFQGLREDKPARAVRRERSS